MDKSSNREIPLRDIVLLFGDYLRNGLRFWWLLVIVGALFGGYMGWKARETKLTYAAPLTFVLNEETGGGGGMGSILGQFGLGGGGGGGTTPEKILALAKSQKIIHGLLLDSIMVDGVSDRTANHIITVYDLVEEWKLPENGFKIVKREIAEMSEKEKKLLKRLHSFLFNEADPLIRISSDDDTQIMKVSARTENQDLSLAMSTNLYQKLSVFYTEESTGNSRASVARLRFKADSVAAALNAAEYKLANTMDTRLGVTQRRGMLQQAQLMRQVEILSLTYGEILRNYETADFALSTRTPFFQTIDEPFTPLYKESVNWKKQLLYGGFAGAFLGFLLVSLVKFYQDIMNPSTEEA
jgi:hypothetical protein